MKPVDETLRTSWTLVSRLKNLNDRENWDEFYGLYRGLILGVAMKAGLQEHEAEDVLQETMASVSRNITEFEADPKRGSFHGWLLKMTRWRVLDQLKKRMPVESHAPSEATATTPTVERIPGTQIDLARICDEEWRHSLMNQALKQLQDVVKPEQYQIFHMLTFEQKSVADVAQILGKSRPQVYLAKHRAAKVLKGILAKLEKTLG